MSFLSQPQVSIHQTTIVFVVVVVVIVVVGGGLFVCLFFT